MTNSKAPWLTRGGAIALMAAAAIALAACSGGGGLNEDEAAGLQQELKEARAQATLDAAARMTAVAEAALAQTAKETGKGRGYGGQDGSGSGRDSSEIGQGDCGWAGFRRRCRRRYGSEDGGPGCRSCEVEKAEAALMVALANQKEAEVERDAALADEATARQQLQAEQQVSDGPRSNGAKQRSVRPSSSENSFNKS